MAKRKVRSKKQVGLRPNNLCPHCGRKVRSLIPMQTGYFVEHWWSKVICKNMPTGMGIAEQIALSRLKKHSFIINEVEREMVTDQNIQEA